MDQPSQDYVKSIVEALLFVSEKPVTLQQLKDACDGTELNDVKQALVGLKDEYEKGQRGMVVVEIAGGYQMLSNSSYANYIRNFYKTKHKERLSKPSLETLAIIAYKQPVTRGDVEIIRGVNSDGVMVHLLNKELIKAVGRKDVPGRPFQYGTTRQFLEYFGLKSLTDLPKLEDFPSLQPADNEVAATSQDGAQAPAQEQEPVAASPEAIPQESAPEENATDSSRLDELEKEMSEHNPVLQEPNLKQVMEEIDREKNLAEPAPAVEAESLDELSSSSLEKSTDEKKV